ncbi:gas vesicle protein GvpJ [Streptomyces sp. ME19-01-6]|uniref:gas vesicle protein GvpJ n=1 Tax=Streptomyces sp. ME19-01-6 TaxID=3028686 RepID=UPI0029BF3795|nr:gas vesicle protein GvpJ [Streptomyces sp. ME19-01-6]MDX3226017.1 gas vesicle structural protein GvpA [Streptomyces sp. ME19-01-6]
MAPTYAPTHTDDVVCISRSGNLYDVLELILDRGMVIDVFLRVSLVGIEILKVDARIVVASVDTYLRFAEACNRLDLEFDRSSATVPELLGSGTAGLGKKAAKKTAKKAVETVGGKVKKAVTGRGEEDEDEDEDVDEDVDEDEAEGRDEERRPIKRAAARPRHRRTEDEED